jgi:hypothetical protein
MTDFTPNGRIPKSDIDALLDEIGSDEWLPDALKGPFFLAVAASIVAILVWLAHGYFLLVLKIETPRTLLDLMWVWLAVVGYSACEMRRLYRLRMREA